MVLARCLQTVVLLCEVNMVSFKLAIIVSAYFSVLAEAAMLNTQAWSATVMNHE